MFQFYVALKCGVRLLRLLLRSYIKAYLRLLSNISVDLRVLEIANCSLALFSFLAVVLGIFNVSFRCRDACVVT